jgi:cobalt transporter subunit CbtB
MPLGNREGGSIGTDPRARRPAVIRGHRGNIGRGALMEMAGRGNAAGVVSLVLTCHAFPRGNFMSTRSLSPSLARTTAASAVLSAVFAILLGGVFVYGVGFASPMAIHNAAHDGRHSFAFPCH